MNKDDQEFFSKIKNSNAAEVLLFPGNFIPTKIVSNNLKAVDSACMRDYGFIPKNFIVFPLEGNKWFKNYNLVVCYKQPTPYTKKSEMDARWTIMNKFEKMTDIILKDHEDKATSEAKKGYIPTTPSGGPFSNGSRWLYWPPVYKPVITFMKHFSKTKGPDNIGGWTGTIQELIKSMRACKKYYYRDSKDFHSSEILEMVLKHDKFMNELLKDEKKEDYMDAAEFFNGIGIKYERVDAYVDEDKLKRNKSK